MKTTKIEQNKELIKILVLADAQGQIIGAAGLGADKTTKGREINSAIRALPGQSLHEIEVPAVVLKLRTAPLQLHRWFSQYVIQPGGSVLAKRDGQGAFDK